jgi:magnesium-transporting ATPase (P-type)
MDLQTRIIRLQSMVECSLNFDKTNKYLGETFGFIVQKHPQLLDRLVCVCNVYARMSPEQKQLLVHRMQAVEYTVAMCGDGANDCGALKVY